VSKFPVVLGSAPPRSAYGDPAWWALRKEEILEPTLEIVDPLNWTAEGGGTHKGQLNIG